MVGMPACASLRQIRLAEGLPALQQAGAWCAGVWCLRRAGELARVTPVASEASFDNGEWHIPVRLQMQRFAWTSSHGGPEHQAEHAQYSGSADRGKHHSVPWAFCVTLTGSSGTHAVMYINRNVRFVRRAHNFAPLLLYTAVCCLV